MATHSSILAWKISWTEEPDGLQSTGWQELDMTNVISTCAAEARLCWNWDCYCRLRLWEQRVLLQNALFHPLSSTPELVRGASLGGINILLNVFLSLFQVWIPNRFFSDVVWAEQNLPSSVCRWFTCQPAHSSETPPLSSPLLTTSCLTNGCPPCLAKGRFHGVGWAWRVSNGRSLRNPPSLPTVHAKLTPTENLVAFEHQKKIILTLKGALLAGQPGLLAMVCPQQPSALGAGGPSHSWPIGPATESLSCLAGFTNPGNCAGLNSVGEEESFSMWSLPKGGLMELESDQESSASPILWWGQWSRYLRTKLHGWGQRPGFCLYLT